MLEFIYFYSLAFSRVARLQVMASHEPAAQNSQSISINFALSSRLLVSPCFSSRLHDQLEILLSKRGMWLRYFLDEGSIAISSQIKKYVPKLYSRI